MQVSVSRSNGSVVLAVATTDAASTPRPLATRTAPSLGLRLLEDLVADSQGRLEVRSGAGRGTVLTVEVAAR